MHRTALFVVSAIRVSGVGADVIAEGGESVVWEPWTLDDGALEPVQYEYAPPAGGTQVAT